MFTEYAKEISDPVNKKVTFIEEYYYFTFKNTLIHK